MKFAVSPRRVLGWIAILLLLALPFGTKKLLFSFPFPFSNVYIGEYSSAFLWGTDLLLIALVGFTLLFFRSEFLRMVRRHFPLLAFLLVALGAVSVALVPGLALYAWVRLALAVFGAFAFATVVAENVLPFRRAAVVLVTSAVFQALLGIYQTATNGDAGLRLLGEPVMTPLTKGVGRVWIEGGEVLRAMGTLPHANIFAGFLVLGIAAAFYLFLTRRRVDEARFGEAKAREQARFRYGWIATTASIVALFTGLVVSFSRSGWIVALALTVLTLAAGFLRKEFRRRTFELFFVLILVSLFLFLLLGWAIAPRAGFVPGEWSIVDRYRYDQIGLEMIAAHPGGVGPGNQLTTGVEEGRYTAHTLTEWWRWQPIHNLYLMIATETGIAGLALFVIFLLFLFVRARPFFSETSMETNGAFLILAVLLLFGLFDHFLWDLETGRLMLWTTIGLLMGATAGGGRVFD